MRSAGGAAEAAERSGGFGGSWPPSRTPFTLAGAALFGALTWACAPAAGPPKAPPPSVVAMPGGRASPFAGEMMTIPGPDKKASGYLVVPVDASTGKHPALIVVHEWLGVDDWLKETTDRLAAKGYVALAVDLYRGKTAPDPATAHELMRGVPEDRALADLEAAFNYLASRSDVDPARIGAIGFCMGGGFALSLAVAEPRLRAAVTNYGRLVTDPATLGRVRASLLGNYGGVDNGIPVEDVRAFDAALHAAHKDVDIKIYESLGHGFMNPLDRAFSPEEARDAWQRIDAFFEKALKPR